MKKKGYMIKNLAVLSAILLSACSSGSTAVTETTAESYSVSDTAAEETGNTTSDAETTEKETEGKTTEDKTVKKDQTEDTSDMENTETGTETETEETTVEDTAEAETTIEETTARENNEESTSEKQTVPTTAAPTTVAQTTKAPAVPTPVATTAAPTTAPTTAAKVLTGITASISNKTRYVGSTLSAADFTVTALYSDGSTATNPYGWYAGPMKLENAGNNTITVVYDTAVTTVNVVASVQQTVAPTTAAPTTAAAATKPVIDNRLKDFDWAVYDAGTEESFDAWDTVGKVLSDISIYYRETYNTGDPIKDECLTNFHDINMFRRACGCSELIWSDVLYEKALKGAKGIYDYIRVQGGADTNDAVHLAALKAEGYTIDSLGGITVGNLYGYPGSSEDISYGCPGPGDFLDDVGHRNMLTEETGYHYIYGAVAYYQDSEGYAYGCFDASDTYVVNEYKGKW